MPPLELLGSGGSYGPPLVCWLAHPWFFGGVGLLVLISAALAYARSPPLEAVKQDFLAGTVMYWAHGSWGWHQDEIR